MVPLRVRWTDGTAKEQGKVVLPDMYDEAAKGAEMIRLFVIGLGNRRLLDF